MRMFLYSIYDEVAEEFGSVFESKNHGTALRSFEDWKSKVSPAVVKNSCLCVVGSYDHSTGKLWLNQDKGPVEVVASEEEGQAKIVESGFQVIKNDEVKKDA